MNRGSTLSRGVEFFVALLSNLRMCWRPQLGRFSAALLAALFLLTGSLSHAGCCSGLPGAGDPVAETMPCHEDDDERASQAADNCCQLCVPGIPGMAEAAESDPPVNVPTRFLPARPPPGNSDLPYRPPAVHRS